MAPQVTKRDWIWFGIIIGITAVGIIALFLNRDKTVFLPREVQHFFVKRLDNKPEQREMKIPGTEGRAKIMREPTEDNLPDLRKEPPR